MNDRFRRFLRLFAPTNGLRDAILLDHVRDYFAFKRYYKTRFATDNARVFPHRLVVVAIIKNEGRYLQEWLEYHKLVGVEAFYLYDNDSTDHTQALLAPYIAQGEVVYTAWTGQRQQNNVYHDALLKLRLVSRWVAYIDADEFIVPIAKPTVPEILEDYQNEVGLSMHWMMYGDNGHTTSSDDLVIERFTAHAPAPDIWMKSIINPRAAFTMEAHHGCFIGNRSAVNENGKKVRSRSFPPVADKIRLNHYWGKTWEEYLEKRAKGTVGARNPLLPSDRSMFDERNRNEVQDDIMKPYVSLIKAKIGK
ncbi:MAG: glycosyltransferase family 92 protein [Burkholderiales bacterium]|jgi:hypothetical protein|nr:glycosyltransferase family 92 protein [Burkholderiales bacterium]